MFYIIYSWGFRACTAYEEGGGGTDCSSRTVENDSRRSPFSVWVLRRGK